MMRFSGLLMFLLGLSTATALAWGAVEPRVVDTKYPTQDVVIASVLVEPPASEDSDATARIQRAIDTVADAGGGTVFLPEGRYLLEGHLLLRNAVTLRGEWRSPAEHGGVTGTILMPVEHHGNADGETAITMQCGAGLRELSIWYPRQDALAIVPYPWTVETTPEVGADNYTLQNVTLVNPYRGFKTGPEANELHTLKNVYMTALDTGVFIDSCTDIGRVIDISISPRWWVESGLPNSPTGGAEEAVRAHIFREATGIDMGRSDWEYLYGLHIEGYRRGMLIRQGARGTTNAVLFGSVFERCATALELRELNAVGLAAVGCLFEGVDQALLATEAFTTVSQFNACTFTSDNGHAVLLNGRGTLTFQNCEFESWETVGLEAAAGGISLLGCTFESDARHIVFGEEVHRVRLLGNTFAGDPAIENAADNADVMIAHRPMEFETPDTSRPPAPPVPAPGTRELVVVTTHGASPDLDDNTNAFREALAAAERLGGATVYVPAGYYRFTGSFEIPSGVELRGCFDVPHHTQSGGSVLMPVGGQGDEDGTPFIQMQEASGMRGLTVWYPEQNLLDIQPYPWTVRSLGPGCWLINVTISNPYQGVDFWTHPSGGHYISYLGGAFLRRGLFVSKCDGDGWVVDVQMNPHYGLRLPGDLPRPHYDGNTFEAIIDQQRAHLEGMIFGRCANQHIYRTFLYAAYDGIAFRDDDGATNARILMHGTDTGSRCAVLNAAGERGLEFVLAQLVPLGKYEVGAIIAEEDFAGRARFFTSQMWAGNCSGILEGSGDILIQQLNTISGGITCSGGTFRMENAVFQRELSPHIAITVGCAHAELIANIALAGEFRVDSAIGENLYARANSALVAPGAYTPGRFSTGWEDGDPQSPATVVVTEGGGLRGVADASCAPSDANAHTGSRALRVAGRAEDAEHSYVYFTLFEEPLRIYPDSRLRYWFLPVNQRSRNVAIDIFFEDGTTLRDSGAQTTGGAGAHPGSGKGLVGEWREIMVPLGTHAGKTVRRIMAAYDRKSAPGPFEAFVDGLEIHTAVIPALAEIAVTPEGGLHGRGTAVTITAPEDVAVRYALDGAAPDMDAPLYNAPIVLGTPGLWELRFAIEDEGALLPWVFAELYDIH